MTLLEYAKYYRSLGFSVIPLHPHSKISMVDWKEYQGRLATDDELEQWFGGNSHNNIGIVTGRISAFVVVDPDSPEGAQFLENKAPKTPKVKTGRQFHLYYRYKEGLYSRKNINNLKIDLQSDGAYVVAPPSIHPSGAVYEWVEGRSLTDICLAEFPDDLFDELGYKRPELAPLYKGVCEGNRNDSLARMTGSWVSDGVSLEDCLKLAHAWNTMNTPPLPGMEIEGTVKSIYERHHRGSNLQSHRVLTKFAPKPFADQVLSIHRFFYEGDKGYLWWYDNTRGIWLSNGEDFVKNYLRTSSILDVPMQKKNEISEIIEDIKGRTLSIDGLPKADINLIPFKNGVYDLRDDSFRGLIPDDYFTWTLPWNYNPDAKCEYLSKLIDSMLPKAEKVTLWELMAYSSWRGYPYQKFFLLLGQGSNGKSTFMNIFRRLIGEKNVSSISLNDIQENRFASSRLYHKLLNISGEMNYEAIRSTGLLKQLTGEDLIQGDRKFLSPIKFTNHAKLVFLTNQLPKTWDVTDAFYRRVFLIDFPKQFEQDPSIGMKITENSEEMIEEYEGLLLMVLKHLKRLKRNNFRFSREKTIEEMRKEYTEKSEPLERFIEEHCQRTGEHYDHISKNEFLERFNRWLKKNKFVTYTSQRLGKELKGLGLEEGKRSSSSDICTRVSAWIGIKWRG